VEGRGDEGHLTSSQLYERINERTFKITSGGMQWLRSSYSLLRTSISLIRMKKAKPQHIFVSAARTAS
jgi:hypothetical protein